MSRRRRQPGFALPLVILLAMVVGVMATVMLQRQGTQRLSVARQLAAYRSHHLGRGIREVVSSWLISITGQPVENMLGPGGLALTITTPDRGTMAVYMEDGQGSALTELTGLSGDDLVAARALRDHLESLDRGQIDPSWVRTVGPAAISAKTAPEGLIHALALVVAEMKVRATSFTRSVRDAREDGEITDADIGLAAEHAGFSPEQKTRIMRLLTAKPDLWLVRVVVSSPDRPANPSRVTARYEGRVQLGGAGVAALGSGLMQSLGSFLSWEERPVE
ncbi:MAG: hypothetical protein IT437_00285 [Phycisphaerales bacterium]|nr:hypothetical protein [Phycisphaerales bacterium]